MFTLRTALLRHPALSRLNQSYRAPRAHDRNVCAPAKAIAHAAARKGQERRGAGGGPVQNNGNMSVRIVQLSVS